MELAWWAKRVIGAKVVDDEDKVEGKVTSMFYYEVDAENLTSVHGRTLYARVEYGKQKKCEDKSMLALMKMIQMTEEFMESLKGEVIIMPDFWTRFNGEGVIGDKCEGYHVSIHAKNDPKGAFQTASLTFTEVVYGMLLKMAATTHQTFDQETQFMAKQLSKTQMDKYNNGLKEEERLKANGGKVFFDKLHANEEKLSMGLRSDGKRRKI